MPNHSPGKLVAVLKRLGLRDSIAAAYLSGLPGRPGQQPRITPAFTNAQRDIAKLLIVRRSHLFGWAPLPRGQETDHVLVRAGTGVILTGPGGKPVTAMGRIIYDTFDPVDVDDVRDFVTGNEGNRSWMYGDGRGFVTIGFGHLVENLGEAQGLNLANKDTGGAATADEVEHDFGAAQTGTSNIADDYEAGAILRLAPGVDDTLFYEDFPTHFDVANDFFPMEDLPTEVQIALFDLAFQIGGKGVRFDEGEERPGGLSRGETYPKLQSALLRHDWAEAGERDLLFRNGNSAARRFPNGSR